MPQLDFKEISQGNVADGKQDSFELFAREFVEKLGYKVISGPDRGSDGGRDIIVQEERIGPGGSSYVKWLVSCKHHAHSGKSVGTNQEINIVDRLKEHDCSGFIGFYSTIPSSALTTRLKGFRTNKPPIEFQIFDNEKIEGILLQPESGFKLVRRFFPTSYEKLVKSRIVVKETNTKTSYDGKKTWMNYHSLRFFFRDKRGVEIDFMPSTAGEKLSLLEISIVFESQFPYGFDRHARFEQLLKTRELAPKYGNNWIAERLGRPLKEYKNAYKVEWILDGRILMREVPELSSIRWLNREFITYPTLSTAHSYDEPRDAPKILFVLKESELDRYDKEIATIPDSLRSVF
jgi:hypothetical protein